MTFPFRPGPPPGDGFRPTPQSPQGQSPQGQSPQGQSPQAQPATYAEPGERRIVETTGHPAVDAALRSIANAGQLAPGEQIAAYEAAHQVLQETLSSIEG
jgi:hypothetical protein